VAFRERFGEKMLQKKSVNSMNGTWDLWLEEPATSIWPIYDGENVHPLGRKRK